MSTKEYASAFRMLLKAWGPAWLVMIADVDAASVITAAENGALYGTGLIWLLVLLTVPLYVVQEVAGRLGTVTGKGLGELMRENFTPGVATLATLPMAGADVLCYAVEYTGIAIGFQIFGIPPIGSVPLVFGLQLLLVATRRDAQVEKALVLVSVVLALAYAISAYLRVYKGIQFTPVAYYTASPTFLFLLAGNIGSTIMPFMLFYQASASAKKGITAQNLWAVRLETAAGAIASELILVVIEVATTGAKADSVSGFVSPKVLSFALSSVAGNYAPYIFGIGIISAGFVALIVISLGSTWGVADAMGWGKNSRGENWFWVYVLESTPALLISVLPYNLVNLAIGLLAIQVVVLIGPAVILGLLASSEALMGIHSLKGFNRILYWALLLLVVAVGVYGLL